MWSGVEWFAHLGEYVINCGPRHRIYLAKDGARGEGCGTAILSSEPETENPRVILQLAPEVRRPIESAARFGSH